MLETTQPVAVKRKKQHQNSQCAAKAGEPLLADAIRDTPPSTRRTIWTPLNGARALLAIRGGGHDPAGAAAAALDHLTEAQHAPPPAQGIGPYARADTPPGVDGYVLPGQRTPTIVLSSDLPAGQLRHVARLLQQAWRLQHGRRLLGALILPALLARWAIGASARLPAPIAAASTAATAAAASVVWVAPAITPGTTTEPAPPGPTTRVYVVPAGATPAAGSRGGTTRRRPRTTPAPAGSPPPASPTPTPTSTTPTPTPTPEPTATEPAAAPPPGFAPPRTPAPSPDLTDAAATPDPSAAPPE